MCNFFRFDDPIRFDSIKSANVSCHICDNLFDDAYHWTSLLFVGVTHMHFHAHYVYVRRMSM